MNLLNTPERRVVAANFLLQLGFQSTYFVGVIGCATYVLGAGAFEVSALVFCLNLALIVGNFCSGAVVDAVGPRKTLAVTLAALAACGVLGLLAPVSYPQLYVLAVANGLLFGTGTTALDAYPRFLADDAGSLLHMNSLNNTATSVAVIAGPALGGVITGALTNQAVFSILALAPLPAIALVLATCEERPVGSAASSGADAGEKDGLLATLSEGVRVTARNVDLRLIFLMGFMGFFAYGAFDSLESLFYRDVLQVGTQWMGWLSAIAGIGGTVGSLLVMRVPKERATMGFLAATLLVTGVGSCVYVGTGNVWVAAVGQMVCGIGFGSMGPVRATLTQERCDPSHVGRVMATMRVGLNSAGVVPLLVAPFLADAFGVQAVLFGASLATVAIALAFWTISRRR
ncbi:MFS transporter [Paratractidigestivibacter faecalis]|uniref:MFS transporter n=1 Tax=Paratractidigestivibacter faecalis TaxID=2292441 RepID=UPI003A91BE62